MGSVLYGRSSVAAPLSRLGSFRPKRGGHGGPPVQDRLSLSIVGYVTGLRVFRFVLGRRISRAKYH